MKPSLYAQYIMEREGRSIIETEHGFATFKIVDADCYITDIYVVKDKRKTGYGSFLADEITKIAKSKNCKVLTGSVQPSTNNPTESIKSLLAYGFKVLKSEPDFIWFYKEI